MPSDTSSDKSLNNDGESNEQVLRLPNAENVQPYDNYRLFIANGLWSKNVMNNVDSKIVDNVDSSKQVSTIPYSNYYHSNKPYIISCHDYYTRQKKIIKDLGIKRKQSHSDVFQCSKKLISLTQQIDDKYKQELNILEEKKRKLEEQYEKRQKIIDTFTYPDNQKIIFVLTIIIDFVLIVLNVLLYKNH